MNALLEQRSIRENVRDSGAEHFRIELNNLVTSIGFDEFIPAKILGQFIGNEDCTRRNWEAKIQKINNIIAAWRHRNLSYKGKALVINGLLTSTLWHNSTSLPVPSWAIAQIEESIYNFFWSYKRHLVNKDILALPVQHGGFNIP